MNTLGNVRTSWLVIPVLLWSVGGAGAAMRQVPSTEYPTIQSAADAAEPGDKIKIKRGVFKESVVFATSGISVSGLCGKTIVDSSHEGVGISVSGESVAIKCLTARHGTTGIHITGDGVELDKVTVINSLGTGIEIEADGFVLDGVTVLGAGDIGIDAVGDGGQVSDTTVRHAYNSCFFFGDCSSTVFDSITAEGCSSSDNGFGLYLEGGFNQVVDGVFVGSAYGGIHVIGDTNSIRGNELDGAGWNDAAIYARGDHLWIADNIATNNYYDAVVVYGSFNWIEDNELSSEDAAMIFVSGDYNRILDNVSPFTSYGIDCNGRSCWVEGNRIEQVAWTAVDVMGWGPIVLGNSATGTGGYGDFSIECTAGCLAGGVEGNFTSGSGWYDATAGIDVLVLEDSMNIAENISVNSAAHGFAIDCDGCFVAANLAVGNSIGYSGFDIRGNGNQVANNQAIENFGAGFWIEGDANQLVQNYAEGNTKEGFLIRPLATATILEANTAEDNHAEGFDSQGTGTRALFNEAEGNRHDCTSNPGLLENTGNICADGTDFSIGSQI